MEKPRTKRSAINQILIIKYHWSKNSFWTFFTINHKHFVSFHFEVMGRLWSNQNRNYFGIFYPRDRESYHETIHCNTLIITVNLTQVSSGQKSVTSKAPWYLFPWYTIAVLSNNYYQSILCQTHRFPKVNMIMLARKSSHSITR